MGFVNVFHQVVDYFVMVAFFHRHVVRQQLVLDCTCTILYCSLCVQVIVDQPEQPSADQYQQPGPAQQFVDLDMAAAGNSTPEEEG